jgi:hypothetical protein
VPVPTASSWAASLNPAATTGERQASTSSLKLARRQQPPLLHRRHREPKSLVDVVGLQVGIVLQNLLNRAPGRQLAQHGGDSYACVTNYRQTPHLERVDPDAFEGHPSLPPFV